MDIGSLAVEISACPYCAAPAGHPCKTKSQRRASYTHGARTTPLYALWREGYFEGERGALEAAVSNNEWFQRRVAEVKAARE